MYGTPVIGADIGGIPELIQEDVTGELFKSGSMEALKEKIQVVWNSREKQEKYQEGCKNMVLDSVDEYCKKLICVYQK